MGTGAIEPIPESLLQRLEQALAVRPWATTAHVAAALGLGERSAAMVLVTALAAGRAV